jgi:hypothetical protein
MTKPRDLATLGGGFTQSGTGAIRRTVENKLKDTVSVKDFGAVGNGVADDTAAINAAILAAHNLKTNVLVDDATYSVVVNFDNGKDYKIVGTILLPNGIVLDGNGSRLIGSYGSAVSTAYNDSLPSIIETGYFNGTIITTNRAASNTTQRITNSGICNFTFINANCGINAINLQETSFIRNCRFNNVSAAMRLKSCYYLVVDQIMIRSSSQATNQYAVLLHGGDCSDMRIQQVSCVGCSVGISVNSTPAGSTSLSGCSFEDAYLAHGAGAVNGIGVYFDAGYFQGWTIANCYFEGVQTGIKFNTGAAAYGMSIKNNFYSSCQSALIGSENSMRVSEFIGNGVADDGGIIRNLVDLSASGNDVFVQVPAIGRNSTLGLGAFITNHTLGNVGTAQTSSVWKNTSSPFAAIAKAEPGLVNQSKLNSLPFEGANIISLPNQVPFVNRTVSVNTLTIDTNITYDDSNVLVFNFYGTTDSVTYDLKGFIFGTTVSWVTRTPITVTATVTNNSGAVRLVFGLLTASVPIINTTGMIRHV